MKKILFLGTHGQKNWGDELLLHVFMHQLEGAAQRLYVNSYDPAATATFLGRPDVTVFNTKTARLSLLRYLLQCDAVVFGGGNILKELYTAYGGSRYATLGVIDSVTRFAKILGKPIYLCNIGIGPIQTAKGRQLTKRIVERAQSTTVRDSESLAMLQSLQITKPYWATSDAVFATDRSYFGLPAKTTKRNIDDLAQLTTIGINLCRNIANNDNWQYFLQQLAQDVVLLHRKNPDIRFVGIPMQYDVASNNDQTALQELAGLLRAAAPGIRFETARPSSPTELAATIDQLDVLLAERLHALVLAMVLGVPPVALVYDIKVAGLVVDLGLEPFSVDINTNFQPKSFFGAVDMICRNAPTVRTAIQTTYQTQHQRAISSFTDLQASLVAPAQPFLTRHIYEEREQA